MMLTCSFLSIHRRAMERELGRTKHLQWDISNQDSDSDSEEEVEEEAEEKNHDNREDPAKKKKKEPRQWPWNSSVADKDLWSRLGTIIKMYEDYSGFRLPDIPKNSGHMKIHDWISMTGSVGAYYLMQSKGIHKDFLGLFIDFVYALEYITLKSFKKSELPAIQKEIDNALIDLEIMCPLFFSGTITRRQLHYFTHQVQSNAHSPARAPRELTPPLHIDRSVSLGRSRTRQF
jgi:hypothetical protein